MFTVSPSYGGDYVVVADDYEVDEENTLVFFREDEDGGMVECARVRDWAGVFEGADEDEDEDEDGVETGDE